MLTTQPMIPITIEQPSSATLPFNPQSNLLTMNEVANQSQPMVMITSFIHQQIDMGINDLIY